MIDLRKNVDKLLHNIENRPDEYWDALLRKKIKEQEKEEAEERLDAFKKEFVERINSLTDEEFNAQFDEIIKSNPVYIEFQKEFDLWKKETSHMSASYYYLMNKHFHRMIGMGWDIVPYIFDKLEEGNGFLLWHILEALTGIYPEYPKDCNFQDIANWWLNWLKGEDQKLSDFCDELDQKK